MKMIQKTMKKQKISPIQENAIINSKELIQMELIMKNLDMTTMQASEARVMVKSYYK
jgi:hypothetical protein